MASTSCNLCPPLSDVDESTAVRHTPHVLSKGTLNWLGIAVGVAGLQGSNAADPSKAAHHPFKHASCHCCIPELLQSLLKACIQASGTCTMGGFGLPVCLSCPGPHLPCNLSKGPVYLKPQTSGKHGTSRPNNCAGAVQATSSEHLLAFAARASAGASWGADWAPRRSRALATRAALRAWKPNCRTKASWVTSRPSSPYRNCTTVLQTPREDLDMRPQAAGCCLCADGMSTHLQSMRLVGGSSAWSPAVPCLSAC